MCLASASPCSSPACAGERMKQIAGILRFRHTLRKLDGVPAEWTRAMDAMEDLQDEPVPQERPATAATTGTPARTADR